MALPGKLPALRKGTDGSATAQIEQASKLVSDFAGQSTLPTLDALIAAAEDEVDLAGARDVRDIATEMTRRTALLRNEVEHFLTPKSDSDA